MQKKILPHTKDGKIYTSADVQRLFKEAVDSEGGDREAVFKNQKNRQLVEMWYASGLADYIYQLTGDEYWMYPDDSPDVHFIKNPNTEEARLFSVEIMTLYDFEQKVFDGDYKKLAEKVWQSKGTSDYDRTELLLVSRLTGELNVDEFATELNKYKWKFLCVRLSVISEKDMSWKIFDIIPYQE